MIGARKPTCGSAAAQHHQIENVVDERGAGRSEILECAEGRAAVRVQGYNFSVDDGLVGHPTERPNERPDIGN